MPVAPLAAHAATSTAYTYWKYTRWGGKSQGVSGSGQLKNSQVQLLSGIFLLLFSAYFIYSEARLGF